MKIGACISGSYERLLIAKEAGYDYAESHCQEIVKMAEEDFEKFCSAGFPVLAANCFIGMKVVGPEKNYGEISAYLDILFERSVKLGMKILVFGSSGARRMEQGMTLQQTREEIVYFLKEYVAPRAEKTGITVVVEPLRPEECNVVNTIAQAVEIAEKVNSPYIKVLADVKHMVCSGDDFSNIIKYKDWLAHAHTSNPYPAPELEKKRTYPAVSDSFNQDEFILPLIEAGVETCSIEADVIDYKSDCEKSIEVLRKYR